MKRTVLIFTSLAVILMVSSCNYFGKETLESFEAIEASIQESNAEKSQEVESLMQKLIDSAMANPEIYASAYNHMNEFHNKSNLLSSELARMRKMIEDQVKDTTDYEQMDQSTDSLFFNGEEYSENGARFIKAIKDYNISSADQLFFFPEAEKLAQKAFSINDVTDRNGKTRDWLEYHFKGYPAIASKTKIVMMENEVKNIEATFLKALIEKPQF